MIKIHQRCTIFLFFILSIFFTSTDVWAVNLPNLRFSQISIEPANPQEGDLITIRYEIQCTGSEDVIRRFLAGTEFRMEVSVDRQNGIGQQARSQILFRGDDLIRSGVLRGSIILNEFAGGVERAHYRCVSGRSTLRVRLDDEHRIAESNEVDNGQIFQINASAVDANVPDLVINQFEHITQDRADTYEQNATLFFRVGIGNRKYRIDERNHQAALENVVVRVSDGGNWSAQVLVPRLEDTATVDISLRTQDASLGRKILTASVDPDASVRESNEANNNIALNGPIFIVEDEMAGPAHLRVTGITIRPQRPLVGTSMTFDVRVQNVGQVDLDLSAGEPILLSFLVSRINSVPNLQNAFALLWSKYQPIFTLRANEERVLTFTGFKNPVAGSLFAIASFSSSGVNQTVRFDSGYVDNPTNDGLVSEGYQVLQSANPDLAEIAISAVSEVSDPSLQNGPDLKADDLVRLRTTVVQSNQTLASNHPEAFSVTVTATNGAGWNQSRVLEFPVIRGPNPNIRDRGTVSGTVDFDLRGRDLAAGDNTLTFRVTPNNNFRESDASNNTYTVGPYHLIRPVMPNLTGYSIDEARSALSANFVSISDIVPNPNRTPSWRYDEGVIISQNIAAGTAINDRVRVEVALAGPLMMPNFVGQHSGNVVRYFTEEIRFPVRPTFVNDYRADTPGRIDDIISQEPLPDRVLRSGTPVSFRVKKARVHMEDVRNLYEDEARRVIRDYGGWAGNVNVRYEASARVEATRVIRQSPESGTALEANSVVELVVSTGPAQMPNLTGLSVEAARDAIRNVGWRGNVVEAQAFSVTPDVVCAQLPAVGTPLLEDTRVSFTIGLPIEMPNVVGLSLGEAQRRIRQAGYADVIDTREIRGDAVRSGEVTQQLPAAGQILRRGVNDWVNLEHIHIVSASEVAEQKKAEENQTITPSAEPIQAPVITAPLYSLDNHVRGTYNSAYTDVFVELNVNGRNNIVNPRAANNGTFDIFMNDQFLLEAQRVTVTLRAKPNRVSNEQRVTSQEVVVQRAAPLDAPLIMEPVRAGERSVRVTYNRQYIEASFSLYINGRAGVRTQGQDGRADIRLDANQNLREGDRVWVMMFARRDVRVQLSQVNSQEVIVEEARPLAVPTITGPLRAGDEFVRGTCRRDYFDAQIMILVDGRPALARPVACISGQYNTPRLNRPLQEGQEVVARLQARQVAGGPILEALSQPLSVQENADAGQQRAAANNQAKAADSKKNLFSANTEDPENTFMSGQDRYKSAFYPTNKISKSDE